jgi:L-serine dehydratase
MCAALRFAEALDSDQRLTDTARLRIELFGSLGATGKGHGSDKAVLLGLEGARPETVDTDSIPGRIAQIRASGYLKVLGRHRVRFQESEHLIMHRRKSLPYHPNGMRFSAWDAPDRQVGCAVFYSVGGGFIVDENAARGDDPLQPDTVCLPFPFTTAAQLMDLCAANRLSVSELMLRNEQARRSERQVRERLLTVWTVMRECVQHGCRNSGVLPGGMNLKRRAPELYRQLTEPASSSLAADPLTVMDWVNLYALAVNEENAAGGRVVTAPTNGAAGIVPAVLHYYRRFVPGATEDGVVRFLLAAGAIGVLYKENASISGAEVGCQGEVGSACSMAAGALAEVLGGTPAQVENAAEIAMEHNLGLTCDPVGGLVQVPCIERNAMAAVKAINAARMALRGDGQHFVSLDKVIKTMRDTGADMKAKYKETARGGLAVNVLEVPVSVVDC